MNDTASRDGRRYEAGKVSAFIPVCNEERFLRECLESVLPQVDGVILGDNASTDGTEAICRGFAERYDSIVYFRHPENIGGCRNFSSCAEKVDTEFVFHLGGHDVIPEGYVAALKRTLLERPDAVGVYADVFDRELDGSDGRKEYYDRFVDRNGDKSLSDYFEHPSGFHRAAGFFACSPPPFYLVYGLFRSATAVPLMSRYRSIGATDWLLMFEILLRGKLVYCPDTHYIRRNNHPDDTPEKYMRRILGRAGTDDLTDYNRNLWPMVESVLQSFAAFSDGSVSDSEKWRLFMELEDFLRRYYQYPKRIPNLAAEPPFPDRCRFKILNTIKRFRDRIGRLSSK